MRGVNGEGKSQRERERQRKAIAVVVQTANLNLCISRPDLYLSPVKANRREDIRAEIARNQKQNKGENRIEQPGGRPRRALWRRHAQSLAKSQATGDQAKWSWP